jgi:hypothetical protein
MKRFYLALFVILTIHIASSAQSTFEIGFLPTLNINKKLPQDWALNFKAESRQSLVKESFDYQYLLTDISFAASKKVSINTSVAFGYLLSINDNGIKNRTFQHIAFVKRYANFRLSHRVLADQTFQKDVDPEFRFRYRISSEIPLQGASLDPQEFFLKLNNEYLNSLQNSSYDLEIRTSALLGYVISPNNKLEFGLDYRVDSFVNANIRNRLWIGVNFYSSI